MPEGGGGGGEGGLGKGGRGEVDVCHELQRRHHFLYVRDLCLAVPRPSTLPQNALAHCVHCADIVPRVHGRNMNMSEILCIHVCV